MKRIGVLTGGGDCPGLNAVIRAVVRTATRYEWNIFGIQDGWKGLIDGKIELLTDQTVNDILSKGGTILGTSRTNPYKNPEDVQKLKENVRRFDLDAIIAIGGDDTLGVALKLHREGIPVVGIPKTIDNDLNGTDYTFGFDTAVSIVTEAIDRLRTTAESHHRVIVVEVMGRHAGWIATMSGIAGGADEILIPEVPFDIEEVCRNVKAQYDNGKRFGIVVVAEGAKSKNSNMVITRSNERDEFGHVLLGGIAHSLALEIEKRLHVDTRVTTLGHVQRGGTPTAHDRILATRFGVFAVECIRNQDFGKMVALQGDSIVTVPLHEAVDTLKTVKMELYDIAKIFYVSDRNKSIEKEATKDTMNAIQKRNY